MRRARVRLSQAAPPLTRHIASPALGATAVRSSSDLVSALAKLDPGTSVQVTMSDAQGRPHPVTLTLGELAAS